MLARHGRPEIVNTDQGSQFTGTDFTGVLIKNEIAISMDVRSAGAPRARLAEHSFEGGERRQGRGAIPVPAHLHEYTSGSVSLSRFLRVTSRAAVTEPLRKLGLVP